MRDRGINPPPEIAGRYRVGVERLFAEMAGEFLDEQRVSDLTPLLERERIIDRGATVGSSDRR